MRGGDSGQMSLQLPRPGPVLKGVLVTLAIFGIGGNLLANWTHLGGAIYRQLICSPALVLHHYRFWSLLTSGLLTATFGQLFFTLIGLYFLSPDLERKWGSQRFAWFLAASVVFGNVLVILIDQLTFLSSPIFHPSEMFGATAVITAIAVAWSRENAETEVRLMFFLPMKGKHLFWLSIAYCFVGIIYNSNLSDGVMAPFGGVLVGMFLGGSPSMARRTYLQLKLALLQRQAGAGAGARVGIRSSARKARVGGPALRVLPGGLEEELRKREPPNDKRYLN
jgi:membrane associated rhomboid family serine protease